MCVSTVCPSILSSLWQADGHGLCMAHSLQVPQMPTTASVDTVHEPASQGVCLWSTYATLDTKKLTQSAEVTATIDYTQQIATCLCYTGDLALMMSICHARTPASPAFYFS